MKTQILLPEEIWDKLSTKSQKELKEAINQHYVTFYSYPGYTERYQQTFGHELKLVKELPQEYYMIIDLLDRVDRFSSHNKELSKQVENLEKLEQSVKQIKSFMGNLDESKE